MITTTRQSPDALRELVDDAAVRLADATADEVVAWAARVFGASIAVACSMADAVLPYLVSRHLPGVDVLFLDTGYHFAETLDTRDQVARKLPVTVVTVRPRQSVAEQDARHGSALHDRDPAACCALRKVEPLAEQLAGYDAWMSGIRREESLTRASTPVVAWDARHQMVKINPLVAWSGDQLMDYVREHDVPTNPLLDDGFPSIGCAPCTRRVVPGEDARAGRWAGLTKTECGIHT